MTDNRRHAPRVDSLNFVAWEGRMLRTLDVSDEGMLLEMEKPVPVGQTMECKVAIGEEVVTLGGKVVRHEREANGRTGVGLEFKGLSPRAREIIDTHVEAKRATAGA